MPAITPCHIHQIAFLFHIHRLVADMIMSIISLILQLHAEIHIHPEEIITRVTEVVQESPILSLTLDLSSLVVWRKWG